LELWLTKLSQPSGAAVGLAMAMTEAKQADETTEKKKKTEPLIKAFNF
jgi:hypothetical protein